MRLLDLFAGAGGAAMGYYRAGFTEIVGVDHLPQPRYPFEFEQGDALEFLHSVNYVDFDMIHASPPCQGYSRMRYLPWLQGREWPLLIPELRRRLKQTGISYVIENVVGAPLLDPVCLCGTMFGLPIYRHRLFECSEWIMHFPHTPHREVIGPGRFLNDRRKRSLNGFVSAIRGDAQAAKQALQVPWMNRDEACQAIPPAYTEWIGARMLEAIA
jgi:DNA (cytosine-5)-methyltransferase 1